MMGNRPYTACENHFGRAFLRKSLDRFVQSVGGRAMPFGNAAVKKDYTSKPPLDLQCFGGGFT